MKCQKKQHRSMEMGSSRHCQSAAAAESRVEVPGEMKDASSSHASSKGELLSADDCGQLQEHNRPMEPCHDRRSTSDEDLYSGGGGQHVHGRKKCPKKCLYQIVSSSDEEADTLKDRFWRDLEEGKLQEDLVGVDLYSSVCQY